MIARDNRKNRLHLQGGVGLLKGESPLVPEVSLGTSFLASLSLTMLVGQAAE
jgi:hypothetical protein